MVTIKDGCGATSCCSWKEKLEEAYKRATASVNKIGDNDGSVYFPDGTGFVKLPLPRQSDVAQIKTNAQDIADLKVRDTQLQANINDETTAREEAIATEETARKAKDELLDADITRIDAKDTAQDTNIKDNSDRITSTNNDLVATEATVATHDSDIITLKAQTVALGKSLVSDVIMTDGTTAGSVQVSIEREDGALITSANYKWGKDIGIRLEAGSQEGYLKTVIDLSDGTTLTSNEYKIVEVLESDVYVTAITLVPDMTAGTIGGNISYSNGTTQTINAVNVPTAPGVTSAIEALQSRMTAVENTNNTQASEITALTNRVQAIEDTPGVGQFGAGKLGTIAGSSTDGRVKAEDDGTGSVNGWSALKQRVTTAEGQIVTTQNNISALDGTVAQQTTDISGLMTDVTNLQNKDTSQDTAIAGKVAINQGVGNAGKALVVGEDGNVAPVALSNGATKITGLLESYYKEGTAPSWTNVKLNAYSIPHTTQSYIVVSPDGNNVYAVTKTDRSTSSTSKTVDVLLQTDKDAYYQEIIKQTFRIGDFSELSDGSYSVEILFRSSTEYCIPLTITFTITNGALASFTSPINYPYVNSFSNVTKTYYVYWWIGNISITE